MENKIEVGNYTYGASNISLHTWGEGTKVKIGKYCSIAGNTHIYLGGNHRIDWFTTYPFGHINTDIFPDFDGEGHPSSYGDVIIGNDVWIGDDVTIMSGITIGNGAVLAAHAVITKDVLPYTVVGGNPAKLIKYRFDLATIDYLQQLKWWDLPESTVNKLSPALCSSDLTKIGKILNEIKK